MERLRSTLKAVAPEKILQSKSVRQIWKDVVDEKLLKLGKENSPIQLELAYGLDRLWMLEVASMLEYVRAVFYSGLA